MPYVSLYALVPEATALVMIASGVMIARDFLRSWWVRYGMLMAALVPRVSRGTAETAVHTIGGFFDGVYTVSLYYADKWGLINNNETCAAPVIPGQTDLLTDARNAFMQANILGSLFITDWEMVGLILIALGVMLFMAVFNIRWTKDRIAQIRSIARTARPTVQTNAIPEPQEPEPATTSEPENEIKEIVRPLPIRRGRPRKNATSESLVLVV